MWFLSELCVFCAHDFCMITMIVIFASYGCSDLAIDLLVSFCHDR